MSVIDNELESNSQKIAEESLKAGKKMFAFVVHEQAEMIEKAVDFATFVPKNIIAGVSEKVCDSQKRGKQSVKKLVGSGATLENIALNEDKIKGWKGIARKYGIDYSLKKAVTPQEDGSEKVQYIIFYKAKDIDILNAAFNEYSAKLMKKGQKNSIHGRIDEDRTKNKDRKTPNRERKRENKRESEVSL